MKRMTWKEFVEDVYNLPVDYEEVWDSRSKGWEIYHYSFGMGEDEYTIDSHRVHIGDDYTGEDYYITDSIGDMYVITRNGILVDGPYATYEEAERNKVKLEKEEA